VETFGNKAVESFVGTIEGFRALEGWDVEESVYGDIS
jgi:hypothetical protein